MRSLFAALALTAALSTAALADGAAPAGGQQFTAAGSAWDHAFVYGNIGFIDGSFSETACDPGFGCISASASSGDFGIQVGGVYNFVQVAPHASIGAFGDVSLAFGTVNLYPINVGAEFNYSGLPVDLLGGIGLAIIPTSGNTSVGADIFVMGIYPLPQVSKNFGIDAKFQIEPASNGLTLFGFTVGGVLAF